jgi:transcriptional regulator with XRE-family HTH domain
MSSPAARELAHLLRARRAGLRPADVGLPSGARRRTPGLRREEVAQLAAISPTYYAFLEQGRDLRPSRQVLDALARALRMAPAERDYLHVLVHGGPPAARAMPAEQLASGIAELLDHLDPHPSYVTGRSWDVLGANRAARTLWTDWTQLPAGERNLLLWMFSAAARAVFVEWEDEAAAQLARFRAAAARDPADPQFAALIERLHAVSPEAREWWARHDVAPLASGRKRLRHPQLGELELRHVVLQVADEPDQKLVTFSPSPRDVERLAALLR